ncbi:MAG: GNAT family N-acetyltransferase [Candidatus Desulforudis sp.]|nr:GNAT family N-acetyltransferase [Desulforudis sp.]
MGYPVGESSGVSVERAGVLDAEEILALQQLAYLSEAELYDEYTIPPLVETLEEIRREFARTCFLKAVVNGRIVGSVRACAKDGTCHIGRLIVHPEYQNRGLGARLMRAIENAFGSCRRFELFTGHRSAKNLYLYGKLGYTVCGERRITDRLRLVYLAKERPQGGEDRSPAGPAAPR